MGTLTKKLHVLKSGGTEETCNIYTTPEEVGGSPYLALEVDGTKGYVKLGSTTDANATHLRVEKNGTTYAAWKQAEVAVPTGTVNVDLNNATLDFTVPIGVNVIRVYEDDPGFFTIYVGVTPGSTHKIRYVQVREYTQARLICATHNNKWHSWYPDDRIPDTIHISWSPVINEQAPDIAEY